MEVRNDLLIKETIVDGLYRYVVEYDGWGVQQDFPVQQDHDKIREMFLKEIEIEKENKKNEVHLEEVRGEDNLV